MKDGTIIISALRKGKNTKVYFNRSRWSLVRAKRSLRNNGYIITRVEVS